MSRKFTTEEYHQQVIDLNKGFTCLGEYQGNITKISHQCSEGHVWAVSPREIKKGSGCPGCSGNTSQLQKGIRNGFKPTVKIYYV